MEGLTERAVCASRAAVNHLGLDRLAAPGDSEGLCGGNQVRDQMRRKTAWESYLATVATVVVVIELLGHRDNHVIGIVGPPAVSCKDE